MFPHAVGAMRIQRIDIFQHGRRPTTLTQWFHLRYVTTETAVHRTTFGTEQNAAIYWGPWRICNTKTISLSIPKTNSSIIDIDWWWLIKSLKIARFEFANRQSIDPTNDKHCVHSSSLKANYKRHFKRKRQSHVAGESNWKAIKWITNAPDH